LSPQQACDGRSLATVIADEGAASPHTVLHWRMGKQWAVRQGPWKLIHQVRNPANDGPPLSPADREWFLVHIGDDPGENHNHAQTQADVRARLQALHDAQNERQRLP
jgi:arylsulfatase A-like enzyme